MPARACLAHEYFTIDFESVYNFALAFVQVRRLGTLTFAYIGQTELRYVHNFSVGARACVRSNI